MDLIKFSEISQGSLEGFLFEKQYDEFVESLAGSHSWFAYEFEKSDHEFFEISLLELKNKLLEFRQEIRERKKHNTFPFTYIKNTKDPLFIKIYDPVKCGSSCSLTTPDPWWVFSRVKPSREEILQLFPPRPVKKSFWKK